MFLKIAGSGLAANLEIMALFITKENYCTQIAPHGLLNMGDCQNYLFCISVM